LSENLKEKAHLKDPDVDGMIILKCILKNRMCVGLHSHGSGHGPVAEFCEYGNDFSCFIKDMKFID
jgi:hypothetical protein